MEKLSTLSTINQKSYPHSYQQVIHIDHNAAKPYVSRLFRLYKKVIHNQCVASYKVINRLSTFLELSTIGLHKVTHGKKPHTPMQSRLDVCIKINIEQFFT